jgi:hypothetical protein
MGAGGVHPASASVPCRSCGYLMGAGVRENLCGDCAEYGPPREVPIARVHNLLAHFGAIDPQTFPRVAA